MPVSLSLGSHTKTNLSQLGDLLQLARSRGCQGMKLSESRAMVAISLPDACRRWPTDIASGVQHYFEERARAIKRAGIANVLHHVNGKSGDTSSRSPTAAPWSIYPFSAEDRAALTCDWLIFETIISPSGLADALMALGLRTEVSLPLSNGHLGPRRYGET